MKNTLKRIMSLVLVFALCLGLAACNITPPDNEVGDPKTFVSIDINPSIELTLDDKGIVVTAYGANEDGTILLYGEEESILGKSYEEAVERITALAAELGYIDEGHKISATVTSDDETKAEEIKGKISATITEKADALGITVSVTGDLAYSLIRELEALKEKYPESDAIQGLTPAKYKLVASATEDGELTITAAAELPTEELIKRVNDAHDKIEKYATEAYKAAKARAEMLYEVAMGVALDGVYNVVYLERMPSILSHPEYMNTFYYGAIYQAYKTTARTLDALDDIIEFGNEMINYELDGEMVSALATQLAITDTSVFADEDGKITLKSVTAYVDNYLRNTEIGDAVEENIEDILDEAEDAAEMAAMASDAYAADLAALRTQIEAIVSAVNTTAGTVMPLLGADAKAELEACLADLDETVTNIGLMMEGGLTEDELEALVDDAEEKAEDMLDKIEADLTEAELERVAALKADAEATITNLTAEFTERLNTAEAEAKAYIESRRAERANADEE